MAMLMVTHDLGVVAEMCEDDRSHVWQAVSVERGTADDVFYHMRHHEYTEGLLRFSFRTVKQQRVSVLIPISGTPMPDPSDHAAGLRVCTAMSACDRGMHEGLFRS